MARGPAKFVVEELWGAERIWRFAVAPLTPALAHEARLCRSGNRQ